MSSSSLNSVARLPSQERATTKTVAVTIGDPTTWTVEFCRKMKENFQGPGNGDAYSRWARAQNELRLYQEQIGRGETIGHPLAKNNCKGPRASIIAPLSTRELKTAYSLQGIAVV